MPFGFPHADDSTILEQADREIMQTLAGPAHPHHHHNHPLDFPDSDPLDEQIVRLLLKALGYGVLRTQNQAANNVLMQTLTLVDTSPHMLVASDPHRLRIKILNTSAGNLYISTDENISGAVANQGNLIIIPKGLPPIEIATTQALYVAAPVGTTPAAPVAFSYWSENNL